MKKLWIMTAASVFMLSSQAFAADATGTASATIVAPIAISQSTAMNFGNIAPTATAGTVVLATNGGTTASNVDILAGSASAAAFAVTGTGSAAYSITLPTSVTLSSGTDTMTVDAFSHDAGATPALSTGADSFNVGATLNVGASQPGGTYAGSYTVSVSYN